MSPIYFRREMSIAAIDGAVEEVADEMACPERVIPPPIGVESTLEANGDGPYPAALERRRKEVEATLATNAAEVRRLAAATAVLGTKLVGGDVYARAGELTMLIMAGDRPLSELIDLLRLGYKRAQAARALQAAVRCRLRLLHVPNRERLPWGLAQAVRPGSVAMFEFPARHAGAARELSLQRLRHGAGRALEVLAAEGRCGLSLGQWLASDSAARQYRGFLRHVPEERRTQLAVRMQRGVELAVEASVSMARDHAARHIQWACRLLRLRQLLTRHRSGLAQLEAWREARKVERKAARARARAGDIRSSRCEAWRGATACADAAEVEEEEGASGLGERASLGAVYPVAIGALLATAAAWSPATELVLSPSPSGLHYLPRPPGVRFSEYRAPSGADLRLRWLWLQASRTTELAASQGVAQSDRNRGGRDGVSDGYGRLDAVACVGLATRGAFQPAALCEAFRLAEGPWALPRPPELERRESWWAATRS